jgi:hypothetical protein
MRMQRMHARLLVQPQDWNVQLGMRHDLPERQVQSRW